MAHGGENNASEFTTTEQLALQGLVGGISTELRGGKFQDGFVSAIISKGVDLGLEGQQLDFYTQGAITMIAGGLASKAGGGSFEDGAIAAEMVFLYNNFGFKVDKNRAGGNGHTTLYLQDKKGNWMHMIKGQLAIIHQLNFLQTWGSGLGLV
ncbi:hypothetical protein BSPWISOXPB_279 [uncultured Gammaproteobacteria bacterium]|nr:hypothetical protein BSPWISOXPB_279 [uncultured Gammaproteobacteria bacterium]